jgi:hypothetical protein
MKKRVILLSGAISGVIVASQPPTQSGSVESTCQRNPTPNFIVFGGGGAPSYNEIALEKNVLYFQRSLRKMGFNRTIAPIYFANGTTGEKTVRYLDPNGNEKFKAPEIPNLQGASSPENLQRWLERAKTYKAPTFFYFTGHGGLNEENNDNGSMLLWKDKAVSVQDFTMFLDLFPEKVPFVVVMAQCYSGTFANMIYKAGDPKRGVALQTRCGFFATIKTQPSVGCTPEVNEADYRDYSSSFYAGLTGRDRTGKAVASADYNRDGKVSYAEAHAFAKVDEYTTDLPISTSESWLQRQVSNRTLRDKILGQPIAPLAKIARPEQRYVINTLSRKFDFDMQRSFTGNVRALPVGQVKSQEDQAYLTRLGMELENVAMAQRVKESKDKVAIEVLNRLLNCESGSWTTAQVAKAKSKLIVKSKVKPITKAPAKPKAKAKVK